MPKIYLKLYKKIASNLYMKLTLTKYISMIWFAGLKLLFFFDFSKTQLLETAGRL